MKNNLVQRGLEEYKAGLLSLLGRIMGRVKGYTSRGGGNSYHHGIRWLYQSEAGGKSTMFATWKMGGVIPDKILVAYPSDWPAGSHDVSSLWLGGGVEGVGRYMVSRT